MLPLFHFRCVIPLSLVGIRSHTASHGASPPLLITYGFHVFIANIYLDRVSRGSRSVYSIYRYFNMTALFFFFFKPSNWDSSQGVGFCLQLKAQCDSARARQPNPRRVRAAMPVQQKPMGLEAKGAQRRERGLQGLQGPSLCESPTTGQHRKEEGEDGRIQRHILGSNPSSASY